MHIEGSLEPELMFKLSKRNKVEIPFKSIDEIKSAYNFNNLDSFLKIYYEGSNVLITEEDFFDLTWEYIKRCKSDNIVHTEIFFDPQSHTQRGINFDTIINGINKALSKANFEFGKTRLFHKVFFITFIQITDHFYHPPDNLNNETTIQKENMNKSEINL